MQHVDRPARRPFIMVAGMTGDQLEDVIADRGRDSTGRIGAGRGRICRDCPCTARTSRAMHQEAAATLLLLWGWADLESGWRALNCDHEPQISTCRRLAGGKRWLRSRLRSIDSRMKVVAT